MSKITVTLIDEATSEPFATVDQPPADLPETFELETTLRLGDVEWSVVNAAPQTRDEYSKSGRLPLRLRRIEMVNPAHILFSLPSICDRIPGLGDTPLAGNELALAEDDWRQFELVSRSFEEGGKVTVLGIAQTSGHDASAQALAQLAHDFDLDLVHWCRCARAGWDKPLFGALLARG